MSYYERVYSPDISLLSMQVVASGGDGSSGDSKLVFAELQSIQKEYRDLSDRFRALQLSVPSLGSAPVKKKNSVVGLVFLIVPEAAATHAYLLLH